MQATDMEVLSSRKGQSRIWVRVCLGCGPASLGLPVPVDIGPQHWSLNRRVTAHVHMCTCATTLPVTKDPKELD